ncbi:MAG: hypothetical protein RTU30_08605 [Candidatus Thorarchaeota archaeon]
MDRDEQSAEKAGSIRPRYAATIMTLVALLILGVMSIFERGLAP